MANLAGRSARPHDEGDAFTELGGAIRYEPLAVSDESTIVAQSVPAPPGRAREGTGEEMDLPAAYREVGDAGCHRGDLRDDAQDGEADLDRAWPDRA